MTWLTVLKFRPTNKINKVVAKFWCSWGIQKTWKTSNHVFLVVSVWELSEIQGQTKILLSMMSVFKQNSAYDISRIFVTSSFKISWFIPGSKRHTEIDIDFASVTRQKQCLKSMAKCSGHQMEFGDASWINNKQMSLKKQNTHTNIYNKIKNKLEIYCLPGSCNWSVETLSITFFNSPTTCWLFFCKKRCFTLQAPNPTKNPRGRKKLRRRRLKSWGSPCSCDFLGTGNLNWLKLTMCWMGKEKKAFLGMGTDSQSCQPEYPA